MDSQNIKVLIVREYFRNKVRVEDNCSQIVMLIEPGKELGLGFARISNVDGKARFQVVSEFYGNVDVTLDLSVPVTNLNGKVAEDICDLPFVLGDFACIIYPHEEEFLVSQDYVVLVPIGTPAQLRA